MSRHAEILERACKNDGKRRDRDRRRLHGWMSCPACGELTPKRSYYVRKFRWIASDDEGGWAFVYGCDSCKGDECPHGWVLGLEVPVRQRQGRRSRVVVPS